MSKIKLPTDEEIQEWGDEYADEHNIRSENPLSPWWTEAEAFINGARAAMEYIKLNNYLEEDEEIS